jgi:hypothetical protein
MIERIFFGTILKMHFLDQKTKVLPIDHFKQAASQKRKVG